jgi:hypothetical protein
MRQYWRHRYCTTGPSDSANPTKKGLRSSIEHMEFTYEMIILLQHILYLYCIHGVIVKWWTVNLHYCMWFIDIWVHYIITCTSCVFICTKSWTYSVSSHLWNICCFIDSLNMTNSTNCYVRLENIIRIIF